MLSQVFKVSLDELVDNDIKNIIIEKTTNTEKLAGMIINIFKALGTFFLIYLIIMIIIFIIFSFVDKQSDEEKSVSYNVQEIKYNEVC